MAKDFDRWNGEKKRAENTRARFYNERDMTHPHRIPIGTVDGVPATALIAQMRLIDTRRLVKKIMRLDRERFSMIRKAVKDML
jgi:hypothetical protein